MDTHHDLRRELATASPGDIVFVDPDTECYSPRKSERYVVPEGVTLASNRGVDGSKGALLHTDAEYSYGAHGLVSVSGDKARVTGIRVRGPHPDPSDGWRDHSYDFEMSGINCRSRGPEGVEVDNVEVWGFAHLVAAGKNAHVHHNYLHNANMKGLGYCVSTGNAEGAIIEYNYGRHWRHFVAASGKGGYEARYNLIDGPAMAHAFDQHSPGGSYTHLHHNTYRVYDDVASGDPRAPFATFRGDNVREARIHHNWSYNDWPMRDRPAGFTDEWITHAQNSTGEWGDIEEWDNHLGRSEPPSSDIGCPR